MTADEEDKARLSAQALGPAAKAFGKEIEPIGTEAGQIAARIARALLRPVGGLIWGYEQVEEWITEAVAPKLALIPEEHRTEPKLMIAGPAIEAMKYAGSEPELRELFANLLASSMDARTAHTSHPAFVEIIKQLTPDEAKILRCIAASGSSDAAVVTAYRIDPARPGHAENQLIGPYSHIAGLAGCEHPELVSPYLNNLCRLGLGEIPAWKSLSDRSRYDPIMSDPIILGLQRTLEGRHRIDLQVFQITPYGHLFIRACVNQSSASHLPPH